MASLAVDAFGNASFEAGVAPRWIFAGSRFGIAVVAEHAIEADVALEALVVWLVVPRAHRGAYKKRKTEPQGRYPSDSGVI